MSRRLASLTLDNLADVGEIAEECRACVFWELDPAVTAGGIDSSSGALEKEAWVSDTLLEWGSCGQLVHVDGRPAGFALFAPPAYVPRSTAFATSPVGADAVLLMTVRVRADLVGGGLGRMLVQGVARDVVRRGIRAVEAFGRRPGAPGRPRPGAAECLLPADYLLAVGFKTVRPHPLTPRLRMDVKSTASWREDMEQAIEQTWERLLGSIPVAAPSR